MIDLGPLNTLRVKAYADELVEINTESDAGKLNFHEPFMFLGQGANILFVKDFPGTIAKINLAGKKVASESNSQVTIEVAAGEDWHGLVMWTVNQGWSGMENMALIPGTVGAAVVGNIAAYGQNQEDLFVNARCVNLNTKKTEQLIKSDCQFEYRESWFKKNRDYLVTSVTYKLSKNANFNTSYHSRYESLAAELPRKNKLTPKDIAEAVIRLRIKKLPDPAQVGTAGSFFKNPLVNKEDYLELKRQIPDLQAYPSTKLTYTDEFRWLGSAKQVKIPAGRLLDELGWKGKRNGRVGTHTTHALTVVNYGGATGDEIYDFAEAMRADIKKNFGINLEYEVQIV